LFGSTEEERMGGERFLKRGGEVKHNLLCGQNYPHFFY
jgi:hypothetical protein